MGCAELLQHALRAASECTRMDCTPPTASAGLGTISGVVTKLPSGEAAAGAVIKILNEAFGGAPPGAQGRTTIAGADGSFVLTNVDAGSHWLVAKLQGFPPLEDRQRRPTG